MEGRDAMRVRCIALYIDFLLYIPLYRKLLYKAKKMILNPDCLDRAAVLQPAQHVASMSCCTSLACNCF